MKTRSLFAALAALALAGCTGQLAPEDDTADALEEAAIGEASSALIDASALYPIGNLGRPQNLFNPATALTNANIAGTQVGSEGFTPMGTLGSSTEHYQTAHYRILKRAGEGSLQIVEREDLWTPPEENPNIHPDTLRQAAISRLSALGMPASEVLIVRQKKANMMASEDMVPRLHSHVTLFERGFHGIPVRDSHASVIFDRAGTFHKLLLHWRPVAPDSTGNQWKTSMTPAQIAARAAQVLQAQGLSERYVKLRYAYVPTTLHADGSATFALRCMAFVDGLPESHPAGPDRPTEIEIPLDP